MSGNYVVGVDVGTQGTKAVLCDAKGVCLAEAFQPSNIIEQQPGTLVEDPEEQFTAVCRTVKQCIEQSGVAATEIGAVAIDGQMAGILAVGADGLHVTPYDSWLDTRCAPYITRMAERAGDQILKSSGNVPSINHGPKILWWKEEHPDLYKRVSAFVQPGSYAAMRLGGLTGEQAFIDVTYLHFSGFADNANSCWNEDLCREFGVDPARLPRILRPHEIAGRVTAEASRLSGLAEGTPVAAGCGDTTASFLAAGAVSPGICVDVAGTASVFSLTSDSFMPDVPSRVLGCSQAVTPGLWHHYAYINGGGMNLEWFRRMLGSVKPEALDCQSFEALNELAEQVEPRLSDPYFIPHVAGRVMPSAAHLRGAWLNLAWSHTVGNLYRSILEAVALEYGIYLNAIRRLDPAVDIREIRITGGGEKSRLWNQIKADVAQAPVVQLIGSRGAPMGSAMVAAYAAGMTDTLQDLASVWIRTGARIDPDPRMQDYYRTRGARYERFVDALTQASPVTE
ncbi:MAG: xylulose kinase [Spirochaetaceae bacterium]|nr:MAG: xylulose kinase [Spirochaetaceae bacterium]